MTLLIWALIGFALVVGPMAFFRWRAARAAHSLDDPSILLAAPPEGMTPAVAARVDDAPLRQSFMSGLLDLASRGEIEFVAEKVAARGAADVGIRIGGATPHDEMIMRNRRQPAGEAEAWLLGRLQMYAGNPAHAPWDSDALMNMNLPLEMVTGAATVGAVLHEATQMPDEEDSPAAKAERQRGLLSEGAPPTVAGPPPAPIPAVHITARDARLLPIPTLFGTFLETYARRHGWLGTLPFFTRLRWHVVGVVAGIAGITFLTSGVADFSDAKAGLGMGLLFAGVVAYLVAPWMVSPTPAGGRVKAQLAAYRRTLKATFAQAATISDALARARLDWLATPDQALAWAVALGLAPDVRALLARSVGQAEAASLQSAGHRGGVEVPPAAMFAGIENIGATVAGLPSFLRPMASWWG